MEKRWQKMILAGVMIAMIPDGGMYEGSGGGCGQ